MLRAAGAAALLSMVLSGCATLPAPQAVSGETLSGRLSVQVAAGAHGEATSMTAAFELRGDPQRGRLDLSTPLGTTLAQASWAPGRVALVTPRGETRFATLDDLTREVLGEPLPLAALFDWLRGRPWPGAPSREAAPPVEHGFSQLGWTVDLARFDEAAIVARRAQAPAVTVRARMDRP